MAHVYCVNLKAGVSSADLVVSADELIYLAPISFQKHLKALDAAVEWHMCKSSGRC